MTHATDRVGRILADIQLLDSLERQLLLEQLETLVQKDSNSTGVSILLLEGLGREIWEGIDAQAYVRQERASWPG